MKRLLFSIAFLGTSYLCKAQDTFSIVALDSTSRQVGSAGASCLDLFFAGYSDPSFLADILPDTGVINTQSYYIQANQDNARIRMRTGDTPGQIISWLVANDALNNPSFKQYGIVGFNGNIPSAAAHTGNTCIDYKNHITGSINGFHYAIQGNILKGQSILDSMESGFRNTSGSLACRLMAAMQGANVVGADTRCNSQNTSSLFAFLQVALPTDAYKQPSLNLGLRTKDGDGIEPIDSLQVMFNAVNACNALNTVDYDYHNTALVYPNPVFNNLIIDLKYPDFRTGKIIVYNSLGKVVLKSSLTQKHNEIAMKSLGCGHYYYQVFAENKIISKGKFLVKV